MFIDFNVGKTAEAAIDNVSKARNFFAKPEIIKKITEQADLVEAWMIKNKNKTGKAGDEIAGPLGGLSFRKPRTMTGLISG